MNVMEEVRVIEDSLRDRAAFAARVKIEAADLAVSCPIKRKKTRRKRVLAYINQLMLPLDDLLIRQGREWLESSEPDPLDFLERR